MITKTHNYLIITALGPNRQHNISELSRACTQSGCNVLNIKMDVLGTEVALFLFLSGNWSAIAKMEALIPGLEQSLGLSITVKRSSDHRQIGKAMTYNIQVSAIDKVGVLNGLCQFLSKMNIPIEEITGHTYINQAGTTMISLTLKINVPEKVQLAALREQFINHCDDNNLDAFLEPARNA